MRFEFDVPYFLFEEMMAGDTQIGGGQSVRQSQKLSFGAYSPGHYLKQFLPKYSSVDACNAKAKAAGFAGESLVFSGTTPNPVADASAL